MSTRGDDGASGNEGLSGNDGASGNEGLSGNDGASGSDGLSGRDGASGSEGGATGAVGATGSLGAAGGAIGTVTRVPPNARASTPAPPTLTLSEGDDTFSDCARLLLPVVTAVSTASAAAAAAMRRAATGRPTFFAFELFSAWKCTTSALMRTRSWAGVPSVLALCGFSAIRFAQAAGHCSKIVKEAPTRFG